MNTAVLMVWRMGPKYGLQESSRDPSPGSRRPTVSGRVAVIRRGGRSLWFIHGMAAGRLEDWARALLMLRNCLVWESILMLAMLPASS